MAGRPPKPSKLKDLEGNRSRREIPKALPLQGLPEMPSGLSEEGERFWRLVAGELGAVGVAKRIDGPALQLATEAWEWTRRATLAYDMAAWCKASSEWLKHSSRLGLTPADRARLTIAATEKPDEDEERFFKVTG